MLFPYTTLFRSLAEGADVLSALFCEIEVTRSGHPRLVLEALSEANRNPAMAKALQKHTKGVHSLLADLLGKSSEEHTSELPSLMRISYAVFCLPKKQPQHLRTRTDTVNTL